MKIKKDMMVKVVAGNFKGLSGKVLKVIPETQRAIVEGVALTKRTLRPSQDKASRIGFKVLEDKSKVRVSKRSGKELG